MSQHHLPRNKSELNLRLRELAKRSPADRNALKELQQDCLLLVRHMQTSAQLDEIPEGVWHFLSDADIRFKDAQYAEQQLAALDFALREMERSG